MRLFWLSGGRGAEVEGVGGGRGHYVGQGVSSEFCKPYELWTYPSPSTHKPKALIIMAVNSDNHCQKLNLESLLKFPLYRFIFNIFESRVNAQVLS